ncbi:hypothetical protein SLEP1_g47187 [Rubroshorea leprosula]|uniref:Endonuclease/exonuclease/phosphatase domain-containing protein n=1 Tax=Rubroshorea leprosula TaxID=152421 RepID=A0AAV5LQH4_9ROSI|nr:hypothetical protein SLEP1_g47187 [Rubroshorea leprosula]
MREPNGREQVESLGGATIKRKHIYFEEFYDNRTKRQKRVSEAKTLTVKSTPHRQLPVSNQFEAFRSSSSSSRSLYQRQNRRNWNVPESSRKWVFSSRDCSNYKDKVIIVSYNILGVENAAKHPDLYVNVPPKFLKWQRRKNLIRNEINGYNASILCFQEVDRFDDLDDLLQKDGFKGVYKARTGEACDGCALFWKDEIFTLLHEENIEFQRFGLRDNVAQLCVLKMNQNQIQSKSTQESETKSTKNRSLLVGNIHVLFNPNRGDIKLGQIRLFLEKAHKLSQEWGGIPVILAGDLNSIPQSAMYQFLESSGLNIQFHDRRRISGQLEYESQGKGFKFQNKNMARCTASVSVSRTVRYSWSEEELMLATGSKRVTHLQHKLKLDSAYLRVPGSHGTRDSYGEPLATSYHSKFMGTVDYIWHTQGLVPVRVLDTLSIKALRYSGLPSERWGSDHLALVCELAFADGDEET